jgi:predicted DNA-binding ribbon-helix-helix protein
MIAKSDYSTGRIDGHVTRCIAFERKALEDLQELAWASNLPLEDLVREAVDRYRRSPVTRT